MRVQGAREGSRNLGCGAGGVKGSGVWGRMGVRAGWRGGACGGGEGQGMV